MITKIVAHQQQQQQQQQQSAQNIAQSFNAVGSTLLSLKTLSQKKN